MFQPDHELGQSRRASPRSTNLRVHKRLIDRLRFVVALFLLSSLGNRIRHVDVPGSATWKTHLLLETQSLFEWIIQLCIRVANFLSA